jgi:hypothetical protein
MNCGCSLRKNFGDGENEKEEEKVFHGKGLGVLKIRLLNESAKKRGHGAGNVLLNSGYGLRSPPYADCHVFPSEAKRLLRKEQAMFSLRLNRFKVTSFQISKAAKTRLRRVLGNVFVHKNTSCRCHRISKEKS